MSNLTRLILIIILVLLSAFFSMSESAFSYCDQIKLKVAADEGSKSSKLVVKCLNKFDKYITANLIGNNVVNILLSIFATILCTNLVIESKLVAANNVEEVGSLIAIISSTLVVFFFGEIIPKSIGKTFSNSIIKVVIYPLFVLAFILTPITLLFSGLIFLLKKIFKVKEDALIDEEDFQQIVGDIQQQGLIVDQEKEIIQSAVEFDEIRVKEAMCPIDKVTAYNIDLNLNKDQLIDYVLDNPYTRIPVYKGDVNNIIGILHLQKLLKVLMSSDEYDIYKMLVKPIYITPGSQIKTVFRKFKKKKTHMAIVKDSQNNTVGIITMEDVLEHLVGDIDESHEGKVISDE